MVIEMRFGIGGGLNNNILGELFEVWENGEGQFTEFV